MTIFKTPWQQCQGVFLWVFLSVGCCTAASALENPCSVGQPLSWHKLGSIYDGDTLRLKNGQKVRVIAINTPELASGHSPAEPIAEQAKQAVEEFFAASDRVGLRVGVDSRDRHGRLLAQVYRASGDNLSAYMLAKGLAWQVVIPPNDEHWQCFQQHEQHARKKALGIWRKDVYPLKYADQLTLQDSGFQRVEGVVNAVARSRGGWWLQLGQLAVRIKDEDLFNFKVAHPRFWLNQRVTIRGWLIDRSKSTAVLKGGHAALMVHLRHQAMLE